MQNETRKERTERISPNCGAGRSCTSASPGKCRSVSDKRRRLDQPVPDRLGPRNEWWAALGAGVDLDVNAIVVKGSDVYVAGAFSHAGGGAANHVAKWDGSTWSALGSGLNSSVNAVAV